MTNSKKLIGGAAAVGLIAIIGFVVWFLFLRDDGPDAATSASAVEAIQEQQAADGGDEQPAGDPEEAVFEGVEGSWNVDTSFGDGVFPFDGNTYVGYRVVEELASIGAFTAVGRTTTVNGALEISGTQITAVRIDADLTGLTSDSGARDNAIRNQALETNAFPDASFTLTEPIELGAVPADGETIAVDAVGELLLHGVTNTVTIPLEATLVGDAIAVIGTAEVVFADYDIDTPSAAIVASIEDVGELELQLFFTR